MRTTKFRCGIVGLAIVIAAGCGGNTAGLEATEGITGAPPRAPTDDIMKPAKSKKAARGKAPSGNSGAPSIPGR